MTTVAVLADPPVEGFVLPELVASAPLSAPEAARLYRAMLTDVCRGVQAGAGDLLVNYRPPGQCPDGVDPESVLRDALNGALAEEVRYEVQVGESFAGRVGNTVTHLLDREGEDTVAAVEPTGAFLGRERVGTAAMKLRSSEVVLGPAPGGRVHFAGFAEPIDFTDAYATPAVETLATRGRDADLNVDFLAMSPVVDRPADLADAVAQIRARLRADRKVPAETAAVVKELGLAVGDDEPAVVRER